MWEGLGNMVQTVGSTVQTVGTTVGTTVGNTVGTTVAAVGTLPQLTREAGLLGAATPMDAALAELGDVVISTEFKALADTTHTDLEQTHSRNSENFRLN